MTRLLGKSGKYVLIDKLKEIMNINEGSWGHPWGSPKRVKIVEKTKMAKIHLIKGKSGNGIRNDMAFGHIMKSYAQRYNKGDHDNDNQQK